MPWVEGRTLNAHVGYLVETTDTVSLANLAASWRRVVGRLQDARFAHGDLQHGSIMVEEPAGLRLVDLDAAWTPSIAKLGAPYETGHPNYSLGPNWGRWGDTFPALVIYVSLLAVEHRPELWTTFHDGNNLVFTQLDLIQPSSTPLWIALESIEDESVAAALSTLKRTCEPGWSAAGSLEALLAAT